MGRKSRIELAMLGILAVTVAVALALGVVWLTSPDDSSNNQAAQTSDVQSTDSENAESPAPTLSVTLSTAPPTAPTDRSSPAQRAPVGQQPPQAPVHVPDAPVPLPDTAPHPAPAPVEEPSYESDLWLDVEEPAVCATGEVTLELTATETRRGDPPHSVVRTVDGVVRNNTTAPVDLPLESGITVLAIDSNGNTVNDLYPEVDYQTKPGEIRPMDIQLEPGEARTFRHEGGDYDLDRITHWVIDPILSNSYFFYSEEFDYTCDFQAPVVVVGNPIPNNDQ